MVKKIRNLKVRHIEIENHVDAVYLKDDFGNIYYKEGDLIEKGYQGSLYGCNDCIYSVFIFGNKTNNNTYIQSCLGKQLYRFHKIMEKYPEFDISFNWNGNHCGNVCKLFQPRKSALHKWNVNQFIDIDNCCYFGMGHVLGLSYNNCQIPFDFYIDKDEWWNLDFIKENKLRMIKPVIWNVFNYNYIEYKTRENYTKINNLDSKIEKEIKISLNESWIDNQRKYNNKIFNFEKMWFE